MRIQTRNDRTMKTVPTSALKASEKPFTASSCSVHRRRENTQNAAGASQFQR
jgi:hypothetical protein